MDQKDYQSFAPGGNFFAFLDDQCSWYLWLWLKAKLSRHQVFRQKDYRIFCSICVLSITVNLTPFDRKVWICGQIYATAVVMVSSSVCFVKQGSQTTKHDELEGDSRKGILQKQLHVQIKSCHRRMNNSFWMTSMVICHKCFLVEPKPTSIGNKKEKRFGVFWTSFERSYSH